VLIWFLSMEFLLLDRGWLLKRVHDLKSQTEFSPQLHDQDRMCDYAFYTDIKHK
jgi:hypothetical protein